MTPTDFEKSRFHNHQIRANELYAKDPVVGGWVCGCAGCVTFRTKYRVYNEHHTVLGCRYQIGGE